MNKTQLFNVAAWVFIIIGVILLIWRVFGNSPAEFNVLIALVIGLLFKVMAIDNNVSSLKAKFNNFERSFRALASDFKDHINNHNIHKYK